MERTFVLVKPDGIQRGLVGEIISRLERKGFQLTGGKLMQVSADTAKKHYQEHQTKPFFGELIDFITSGPAFAMVWEGPNVIATVRQMMGKTNPADSAPGTIRGDFGVSLSMNIIHGSDSPASAERELSLWFGEGFVEYERAISKWI